VPQRPHTNIFYQTLKTERAETWIVIQIASTFHLLVPTSLTSPLQINERRKALSHVMRSLHGPRQCVVSLPTRSSSLYRAIQRKVPVHIRSVSQYDIADATYRPSRHASVGSNQTLTPHIYYTSHQHETQNSAIKTMKSSVRA